jgi:hypothetical protein
MDGRLRAVLFGQAIAVKPLTNHPGWLAKLYRPDQHPEDAHRLDLLISAPGTLPEADRAALYAGTCWPAARIHEPGNPAVGCVIPMAPEQYRSELRRGEFSQRRFVEIDWLAKSDESIRGVGLPPPGFAGRLAACRQLTELAAILESLGLSWTDDGRRPAFHGVPGTARLRRTDRAGRRAARLRRRGRGDGQSPRLLGEWEQWQLSPGDNCAADPRPLPRLRGAVAKPPPAPDLTRLSAQAHDHGHRYL